jgi:MFS transporter, PAT family, beta-lactamase induction signal transducer AmpG
MLNKKTNNRSLPASGWVISLYFIEGLPYSLVNTVSVALFKTLEISNSQIGLFTSLFYLPWAIKFLWAPIIDYFSTRRKWIIVMQGVLAILVSILALCIFSLQPFPVLCFIFALIAFASATYDIACDGYYLDTLNKAEQSLYIGWRNTAYKMAWLFASGFLVYLAGQIASNNKFLLMNSNNMGWSIAFAIAALVFALASILHNYALPKDWLKSSSAQSSSSDTQQKKPLIKTFQNAFYSFFQQEHIVLILLWILSFRAGDAMLLKMAQPFLLELKEKGGLGLSLQEVGFIYGSLGMICLLLGGLIGGWLVFRYGLKNCLLPAAILQSLTLPLYWLLAIFKPALFYITLANGFEQFVYGLATAAYTNYLFTIAKDKFVASHYAIATGFMAFGMILPGAISGYLVDLFGYKQFFLFSFLASLPGILCTLKLPFTSITTNNN